MAEMTRPMREAANAALVALCALEDELDRLSLNDDRLDDDDAHLATGALNMLRSRWENDTERKVKRAFAEVKKRG